jgi:SAM-dependent methyltransferase
MTDPLPCPGCRAAATRPLARIDGKRYLRCDTCQATVLDPAAWLAPEAERARYRLHRNDPDDPGYRRFLARLVGPLLARLTPGARVLDFGCGPGPALAAMLREAGHRVTLYDPLFFPDAAALTETYDAITCTEVLEHLHHPADEVDRLGARLRPGGILAVMTAFAPEDAALATWSYRRDPTHVVFYREATLRHLAAQRGWTCEVPVKDVALLGTR